jgi:uncharacterized membrane-anchored protein YitT (DUF2179 family)
MIISRNRFSAALGPARQIVWNLLLLAAGSLLCGVAINGILIPQKFFGAGFAGVCLVIHYLIPVLPVAALYFLLNIPVFTLGWKYVGRRFFLYSIPGTLIFTAALQLIDFSFPLQDKILSALLAGIIVGVGSGIILRSLGSAGGVDILSVIFLKRFSIRLGTTILAFNSIVLIAGALLFSLEDALYTMVYLFVNARVVNLVVTGLSQRKAAFIISPQWQRIADEIMNRIHRGVTIIEGEGAYSGKEEKILYTVFNFSELPRLKEVVRKADSNAFVVVSDTLEVMGQRVGNQPHW